MKELRHTDHRRFVETEGWEQRGTARGSGRTGDHFRYTLRLANGEVLHTRVSHGAGAINDPHLVAAILRDQLQVTEQDFRRCVDQGVLPPRPAAPSAPIPERSIDAKLVRNLIRTVGLTQHEVAAMTRDEAVAAWQAHLAERARPTNP